MNFVLSYTRQKYVLFILAIFVLFVAFLAASTAPPFAGRPQFIIKVRDGGLFIDSGAPVGTVEVEFKNEGLREERLLFAQLNAGASLEALGGAYNGNPWALLPQVSFLGGPSVPAGESVRAILELSAGDYMAITLAPDYSLSGGFQAASEHGRSGSAPLEYISVELSDAALLLPDSVAASEQVWEIVNSSQEQRELQVIRLEPDETLEQVTSALSAPETAQAEVLSQRVASWMPMDPGRRAFLQLNLSPGSYAVLSFPFDPATGALLTDQSVGRILRVQ